VRDAYLQRRNAMVQRRTGDGDALPDYGDDEDNAVHPAPASVSTQ